MKFRHDISIETGDSYANAFGDYLVISNDGKMMEVRYLNGPRAGTTQRLEMAGQARVIHNEKVRREQELRMTELNLTKGPNEAFTLGFLSMHSFLAVRVKEYNQQWFENTYQELTGDHAPEHDTTGNYYTVSMNDVQGYGDYFHFAFPTPPDYIKPILSFGEKDHAPIWETFGSLTKYNSRNYVLNAIALGFRLGKKHEIDMILSKVEDKVAFEKGVFFDDFSVAA